MLLDDGPDGAHYFPLQTQIVLEVLNQLVGLKGTLRRPSMKFGNILLVPVPGTLLSFQLTLPPVRDKRDTRGHCAPICYHVSCSFDFPSASLLVSSSRALMTVSKGRIK